MTHPGIAFAFAVGVGLAAIFYYMYNNSNNNNQHTAHGSNSSNGSSRSPDSRNSWSPPNRAKARVPGITSGSIPSCTICLGEISMVTIVHILPCGHPFHRKCIDDWRDTVDMLSHNSCPNCRRKIETVR